MARLSLLVGIALMGLSFLLQAQPRISRADAQRIAQSQAPGGELTDGLLVKRGSRQDWYFRFDLPGRKYAEVFVDARTGKVVETQTVARPPERKKSEEKKAR